MISKNKTSCHSSINLVSVVVEVWGWWGWRWTWWAGSLEQVERCAWVGWGRLKAGLAGEGGV